LGTAKKRQKEYIKFLRRFESFEPEKSVVEVEKHIGFISEDETEGGRIDILLLNRPNDAIIIENKIKIKHLKQNV